MSTTQAVETTATIAAPDNLRLDEPLPQGTGRVRVIVLLNGQEFDDSEISETQWLRAASVLQKPDFEDEADEVFYSLEDGEPFDDEK